MEFLEEQLSTNESLPWSESRIQISGVNRNVHDPSVTPQLRPQFPRDRCKATFARTRSMIGVQLKRFIVLGSWPRTDGVPRRESHHGIAVARIHITEFIGHAIGIVVGVVIRLTVEPIVFTAKLRV